MNATEQSALERAIAHRERECLSAIDRLRELASDEAENEVHEVTSRLRECIVLASCLRRLTRGRTVAELHAAFGAPGDFGYETPIGEALSKAYQGQSSAPAAARCPECATLRVELDKLTATVFEHVGATDPQSEALRRRPDQEPR